MPLRSRFYELNVTAPPNSPSLNITKPAVLADPLITDLAKSAVSDVLWRAVDDHLDLVQPLVELVVLVHELAERPGRVHAGHIGGVPGQVTTGLLRDRSGRFVTLFCSSPIRSGSDRC